MASTITWANDEASNSPPLPLPENRKRPAPRGTAAYPRKRAVTACQVCRARKTKCDNLKPSCTFCKQSGAVCVQSAVDLSSFDPASLEILRRLDEIEQSIRSADRTTREAPANLPVAHTIPTRISDAGLNTHDVFCLLPPAVEKILALLNDSPGDDFPTNLSTMHSLDSAWTPTEVQKSRIFNDDPSPSSITALLDNFFENVHINNPILDEFRTRALVSRQFLEGLDNSAKSCLALLICGLGALSTSFGSRTMVARGSPACDTAMSYFHAAQKRLGPLLLVGGLLETQCIFLSGVFLMTLFDQKSAWRYFLQALACCQLFDGSTQTEGDEEHNLSAEEQAICWSAWKSELELRSFLRPADFYLAGRAVYPPFYPTPPIPTCDPEEMSADMQQRQNRSWYFYLSEISLRRTSAGIIQELGGLRNGSATNALTTLFQLVPIWEAQLIEWLDSLSPSVSLNSPQEEDDICRFVLRGHLLDLYEMIYWPFVSAVLDGNINKLAGPDKERAWSFASRGFYKHAERLIVNEPGFNHRHHGTLAMITTCTRSAAALLMLSKMRHTSDLSLLLPDTLEPWLDLVLTVVYLIRNWQSEEPRLCRWADILENQLTICQSRV